MQAAPVQAPLAPNTDTPLAIMLWVITILMGSGAVQESTIILAPTITPLLTLVWLGLYAMAFLALCTRLHLNWIIWLIRYRLLLVLVVGGALVSATWAVDQTLALQRSIHLAGCTVLAAFVGFSLRLNTLLTTLLYVSCFLLLCSIVAALTLPALGLQAYEGSVVWRGVFANKNALGFWCAMTLGLCYCLIQTTPSSRRFFVILLTVLIGVFALFKSASATSILALLVGVGMAVMITVSRALRLGLAQQALVMILGGASLIMLWQALDTQWLNQVLGRTGNLTGRGEVWEQTLKLIAQRPLQGYGYGNLWNPTESSLWIQQSFTDFTWTVFHAHNGVLQVASDLGLIVTTLAVLYAVQQLLESLFNHEKQPNMSAMFIIVYSVGFLLSNYSEARFLIDRDLFWILYLAMPISLMTQANIAEPLPGTAPAPYAQH